MRYFIVRRFIVLCALLGSFLALPAFAIPGVGALYAGVGTHTYSGFPGQASTSYGGTLEFGLDDLVAKFGLGVRLDLPTFKSFDPAANIELRYSVFSVPMFRALVGAFGGVQKGVGFNGMYGLFAAARVSLGLPYIGLNLGGQGVNSDLSAFGQITLGVVF